MLNYIWLAFFVISFIAAICQSLFGSGVEVWNGLVQACFASAKSGFEISIGLTGILCFWLGMMKIAESSGIINYLTKLLSPLFKRIMPEVPANHKSFNSIIMNMAANILGLDNAATPAGIKAMKDLQEINPKQDTASNAQIMFMVINSSSVTLLPITIFMYRAQMGAISPTAVFIPILLATSISTLVGFLSVVYCQKIKLDKVISAYLIGAISVISSIAYGFLQLPENLRSDYSSLAGNFILFAIIISFLSAGAIKRIPVYDEFVKGAKEGFNVAISIIPYLVAMLVAIGVLRASGAIDLSLNYLSQALNHFGFDASFVAALPTAIMKPLSGSGARGLMLETMSHYGADSLPAFMTATIQGCSETTFYVLAVYMGSAGVTKVRHGLACALLADLAGIIAAIYFSYKFFA